MTSQMQFEKNEGWSFWTGISVKGLRRNGQVRRYKKKGMSHPGDKQRRSQTTEEALSIAN